GVQRIDATTPHLWVIGRTQTNGPADYQAVHAVQAGYTVTTLDGAPAPQPAPETGVDLRTPPLIQVNRMSGAEYFAYAAELLKRNPPHATDWSVVARMRRLGIVPGTAFAAADQSAAVQAAIAQAPATALGLMRAKLPTLARVVNGWQMNTETMGVYGNAYLKRAIVAMVGLGANQPEDAIYPLCVADAAGAPLVGEGRYVLTFPKGSLPPVGAFWSLTMYDGEGFQVANPLNRFAIGDRDPLVFNPDGSLDIVIQHARPAEAQVPNWLPAPATGAIGLTMRLYAPKPEALDGRWVPPAVRRLP
ncbi:MAG: hypothetical protein RLZZ127_2678, partial [Planctomycetota bacterium]